MLNWNVVTSVLAETALADGYVLRQMRSRDVDIVIARLLVWYPDVVVGAERCHLNSEFFLTQTALFEAPQERSILPIVVTFEDEPVGMVTYERNVDARTITSRLGALAQAHRGSGLALLGPILLERLGRAMQAEMAYYFATLKSKDQQVLAERMGFQLVGVVPAFDRDMVRPGEVKRVYEALYAKVLVAAHEVEVPKPEQLTKKTRQVMQALFGGGEKAESEST